MGKYVSFVSDENLIDETKKVINAFNLALKKAPNKVYDNAIDPFSAVFQGVAQGLSVTEWLELETNRQTQKTLQNAIGTFHQNIIGSMSGWESLPTGSIFDVRNTKLKVIAEIKNKYNTTKGNHRIAIYDDLAGALAKSAYKNFIAYLVEVIPKSKKAYNSTFTPSDNNTHARRLERNDIRIISGQEFYDLASGHKNSLKIVFEILPELIANIIKNKLEDREIKLYRDLFFKTY